jgi:hypothetical protein
MKTMKSFETLTEDTAPVFRALTALVRAYLVISVLGLLAVVLLRNDPTAVTPGVWIRMSIVVASALLTLAFTRRAAAGSKRALLRLRLVSAAMTVAIVVIVALPGAFPTWMRWEQALCGVILLGVAVLANGRRARALVS